MVDSSSCVSESTVRYLSQAVGSVRGESQVLACNPNPTSVYSTVLLCCFNSKTKKEKIHSSGAQRRESSHREIFVNAACFSPSAKKKGDEEKGVGKAGSQESGDRREEEENLAREQVGQCSCSLVWCVFVSCVHVLYCQRVHLERVCSVCVYEYIRVFLHVCWDVYVCVYSRSTRR